MKRSSEQKALRVLIAVLAIIAGALLGVLAGLLVRYFVLAPSQPAPTSAPAHEAAPPPIAEVTPEPTAEPTPEPTPSPTPEPTAEPTPTPIPVELEETEDAGQEYIGRIVFLGDSTTFGLGSYGILPYTQIWTDAIGTMSLFNWAIDPIAYYDPATPYTAESLLIPACVQRRQPDILVITLGINGVALLNEEQFKDYYADMLEAIQAASPDTKIICQSVYPVIDSETPAGINNEKVNAANRWIYDVAEQAGVRYLNTHDLLMDETGGLLPAYNNGDGMGIHLNEAGFAVVLQNVRTHAWQ